MSRSQVNQAFAGVVVGMLVAILSTSMVATSLPRMVRDLDGNQATLTWIVTGALLALTVSTPIWGKLSDLFPRKALIQIALTTFIVGSVVAGLAHDIALMIAGRAVQGLAAGGLLALAQIVMSDILSPRERGKYMGVLGAVVLVGTAGGPLLGGAVTDAFGWRWDFLLLIPFAVAAMLVIQATLTLPRRARDATIDYLGAVLLAAGVSTLLIWLSLGGQQFAWDSVLSGCLALGSALVLCTTVVVESRAAEPIIPLRLFRDRTFALSVLASISVGISLYSLSVYLSQYMQLARGATPTHSGVLTLPQTVGTLLASTVIGALVSRTGRWKMWMVIGAGSLSAGLSLLSTVRVDTPYGLLVAYMTLTGTGLGMILQNLVLIVQNSADIHDIGAASSSVAFFRSLGGTLGVTVLGAILSSHVSHRITSGLREAGIDAGSVMPGGSLPDLRTVSPQARHVIETAYGSGTGLIFLVAAPSALLALLCIALLPNAELGTRTGLEQAAEAQATP